MIEITREAALCRVEEDTSAQDLIICQALQMLMVVMHGWPTGIIVIRAVDEQSIIDVFGQWYCGHEKMSTMPLVAVSVCASPCDLSVLYVIHDR